MIITIPVGGFGGGIGSGSAGNAFGVGSAAGNPGVATGGGAENAKANAGVGGDSGLGDASAGPGSGTGDVCGDAGLGIDKDLGSATDGAAVDVKNEIAGLENSSEGVRVGVIEDVDRGDRCDVDAGCKECANEMGLGGRCPDGCRGAGLGEATGSASLGWLGPISEFTARLASCDAKVTGIGFDINGSPLDMSVTARLFTGAVRKAIDARDGGCIKCGGPACWTDCHHIVHYAEGGETTVDNGCLLCRSCHTSVHHEGWEIFMGADRHPWLVPPASVDPKRRPLPSYNRRTMRLDDPIAA